VTIKVHGNHWAPLPSLLTRDQLSTHHHHATNTPCQSHVPSTTPPGDPASQPQVAPAPALPFDPDPIPDNLPGTAQRPFDPFNGQHQVRTPHAGHSGLPPPAHLPGLNQPFIAQQVQPFPPPPIRQSTPNMGSGDTPFNHSSRSLFHPAPPTSVSTLSSHPGPTPSRHFDYERASLENEETRRSANMEFLSICLLLAHPGPPSHALFDPVNRRPLPSEQNIFPQEPCHYACCEILSYLDMTRPALLHNSGGTYLVGILSANGIDFQQAYWGSFFTNKFFGSIINVESWLVSPHASPALASSAPNAAPSLHIFDFLLSCITSISHGQNLPPAARLTPLQARHVGNLIYYCFAALDIKDNFRPAPSSLPCLAVAFSHGFSS
jgi:hypothetical protein